MSELDVIMLDRAARAAWRGAGRVEPNPMVGCVIGREDGTVHAVAHHQAFGGSHAEASALSKCVDRGVDVRGATAWVTLEPCNHFGKTLPCATALIAAGVGRVVYAASDPHPSAQGGAMTLRRAGIEVVQCRASAMAIAVSMPFVKRVTTGLPWVIAKWAQTADGVVAFRGAVPRWVSGERSRSNVHALRGRVDAIITGIGSVLADDPLLTARDVRVRRVAIRVVLDTSLRMPTACRLVCTARDVPTVVMTSERGAQSSHAAQLVDAGVRVVPVQEQEGRVDLRTALAVLARQFGVATALLEAGPGLIDACATQQLIDEAWVYIAPKPEHATGSLRIESDVLRQGDLALVHDKRMGTDRRRIYWAAKYLVTNAGSGR